jgi:glycine betaine/proline transport system permease protein
MNLALPTGRTLRRHKTLLLLFLAIFILLFFLLYNQFAGVGDLPTPWEISMRDSVDAFRNWTVMNRATHPMFTIFFDPLGDFINGMLVLVENVLLWLPWVVVAATVYYLGWKAAGHKIALLCTAGLVYMGLVGLWDESMETLALMVVSVLLSLVMGIPLGILAAGNDRFAGAIRPVLDFMQTIPAFVYLIPILLFFSVGPVAGVIPTVIYAMPPAIRLTNLGIRQVNVEAVEVAGAFGSTRWQTLYKVQLPLAMPSIMMGVNQTIMMALGIVVIAALVGAGGLGDAVLKPMQRIQVGRALEAGLAIVFMAVILDRISAGFGHREYRSMPGNGNRRWNLPAGLAQNRIGQWVKTGWQTLITDIHPFVPRVAIVAVFLVLGILIALFGDLREFPTTWNLQLYRPVDATVIWMRDNLFQIGDLPIGTGPFSDFIVLQLLNPLRALLRDILPWPAVILAVAILAWATAGRRLALLSVAGLVLIGFMGMWDHSMDTLSQVLIAVVISLVIALPVGILAGRNDTVEALLRPLMDFLQTIPPFVYLVPVIMLFNVGRVPGIAASVLYALPPGIRLTSLGIRQVAGETVEAARAFGSTPRQTLFKVQLPLAMPSIMMGINQTIMMVLAMVIIAGLVGGGALGLEAVEGLARSGQKGDLGEGLQAGLAIGILAIILDRITQVMAQKQSEN